MSWCCPSWRVDELVGDAPIGSCFCFHGWHSLGVHWGDGGGRCGQSPTCWAAIAKLPDERVLFVLRQGQMRTCRFQQRSLGGQQRPTKAAYLDPYFLGTDQWDCRGKTTLKEEHNKHVILFMAAVREERMHFLFFVHLCIRIP